MRQQTVSSVNLAVNYLTLDHLSDLSDARYQRSTNLEEWLLPHYIKVAADLNLVGAETATQCLLAKDFRNLIHPGRAQRLGQVCNRGMALSAVAAVEHVINDLTP